MVSVHSLHATLQMNKGAMLPPALTREGPDGAGRTGCSCWASPVLGWGSGWGTGCGAPGCSISGEKEYFWHVGPDLRHAEHREEGSQGEQLRSAALSRQSGFTKKGTLSTSVHRGLQRLCLLCLRPRHSPQRLGGGGGGGGKWQQAPCSALAARQPATSDPGDVGQPAAGLGEANVRLKPGFSDWSR